MIFNTSINCFKESVQIIRDSCFTRRCRTISSSILETSIEERFKRFEYINSIIILSDVQIYCDYLSNISASSFISTLMINYQINLMRSSGNQIFSKFRSQIIDFLITTLTIVCQCKFNTTVLIRYSFTIDFHFIGSKANITICCRSSTSKFRRFRRSISY